MKLSTVRIHSYTFMAKCNCVDSYILPVDIACRKKWGRINSIQDKSDVRTFGLTENSAVLLFVRKRNFSVNGLRFPTTFLCFRNESGFERLPSGVVRLIQTLSLGRYGAVTKFMMWCRDLCLVMFGNLWNSFCNPCFLYDDSFVTFSFYPFF